MNGQTPNNSPNFWQVVMSVCAALFGVQNDKNRQRDFRGGNIIHYIIAGVIGVILMVAGLVLIVNIVLS